jgi:hypothetical protein
MPEPLLEEEPKELAPVAATEWPELVKELFGTSSDEGEEEGPRDLVVDLVVDLGHYRDGTGRHAEQADGPQSPEPDTEPVLAGASAAAPDRSGLLGVVRSAFARNKAPHEHEFTEAPGGIGIVRQICGECGYISIGLSD